MSDSFRIERSTTIQAPAAAVYAHVVDLQAWQGWSPWEGADPDLERTYSPQTAGAGAWYAWSGNRKAGSGRMEITEAQEPGLVALDLAFLKPFKAQNTTQFEITESGGTSTVRWVLTGEQNRRTKLMGKVFNLEGYIGGEFEKGLASLKRLAEGTGG